jgi:hypothetical protein
MLGSVPIELGNSDCKSECCDNKTVWIKLNIHDVVWWTLEESLGDALIDLNDSK